MVEVTLSLPTDGRIFNLGKLLSRRIFKGLEDDVDESESFDFLSSLLNVAALFDCGTCSSGVLLMLRGNVDVPPFVS